jgi:molybdate transport system substrate-binding protein
MAMRRFLVFVAGLFLGLVGAAALAAPVKPPIVLAAASLQESLGAAADAWAKQGHARPTLSFAGSSALARRLTCSFPLTRIGWTRWRSTAMSWRERG